MDAAERAAASEALQASEVFQRVGACVSSPTSCVCLVFHLCERTLPFPLPLRAKPPPPPDDGLRPVCLAVYEEDVGPAATDAPPSHSSRARLLHATNGPCARLFRDATGIADDMAQRRTMHDLLSVACVSVIHFIHPLLI